MSDYRKLWEARDARADGAEVSIHHPYAMLDVTADGRYCLTTGVTAESDGTTVEVAWEQLAALRLALALEAERRSGVSRRRIIVLGGFREIATWCKAEGVRRREVLAVTPYRGALALRGLSGDFEIEYLPSWSRASAQTRAEVDQNLTIIGHTGGAITPYERRKGESR